FDSSFRSPLTSCDTTREDTSKKRQDHPLHVSVASCGVDKDITRFHQPVKCNGAGLSITSPKPQGGQQWSLGLVSTVCDGQGEAIRAWLGGSRIHTDGCKGNQFGELLALWPRSQERRRYHL